MSAIHSTPQVWIADLAAYNEGHLHGKWVDATDVDAMHEAGAELIKTSPAMYAEELAIHDYDGFPSAVVSELGEYPSFETVANVATAIEEHGEAFSAWLSIQDSGLDLADYDLGERFQESFRGEWDSEKDYAYSFVDDGGMGEIPDHLASYIDYDLIVRDVLFQHGPYTFENGYVFEDVR